MPEIALFVEDAGHEAVIKSLVFRFASLYQIEVKLNLYSVRGGHGKVINELRQFLRDVERGTLRLPDLLIVAIDANCRGYSEKYGEIKSITDEFSLTSITICAIPDPHIERWLLLDSAAFKTVLGKGCQAPNQKCERDRYKRLLIEAVRNTGRTPLLGGMEHAENLMNAIDLDRIITTDDSFGRFIQELHRQFKQWS